MQTGRRRRGSRYEPQSLREHPHCGFIGLKFPDGLQFELEACSPRGFDRGDERNTAKRDGRHGLCSAVVATVTTGGSPTSGVAVTFTAPGTGASGTFTGGTKTETDTTNASGVATSTTFTANTTAGAYAVTASATGASTPASFNPDEHSTFKQFVLFVLSDRAELGLRLVLRCRRLGDH